MKTVNKSDQNQPTKTNLQYSLVLLIFFLLIITNAIASQKNNKENLKENWVLVLKSEKIELYERWLYFADGKKTLERKGIINVSVSVEDVAKFITNIDNIKVWMGGVKECYELKTTKQDKNLIYLFWSIPWPFKDKDLVAQYETTNSVNKSEILISYSAVNLSFPQSDNAERLTSYEATWTIKPRKDGTTQVILQAYSQTPPVVPRFIQNPITAKIFKENLLKLRQLLIQKEINDLNVSTFK